MTINDPQEHIAQHFATGCTCCGTPAFDQAILLASFDDLVRTLKALTAEEEQELEDEIEEQERIGDVAGPLSAVDDLISWEVVIMIALATAAASQAKPIFRMFQNTLSQRGLDRDALLDTADQARSLARDTFDEAEDEVRRGITGAVNAGEARIAPGLLTGSPTRQEVIAGMVRSTRFFTNEFFNTQVVPALVREVDRVLEQTGPFETPDITNIRRTLDTRLRSVPYWRVVANAAASRSFHFGYLKAAQLQGFTVYRYTAVLDDRTSEICAFLNNQEWQIATAVDLLERVGRAENPQDAKALQPWLNVNEVRSMSNAELANRGVIVPPVHGNCRSTITPI